MEEVFRHLGVGTLSEPFHFKLLMHAMTQTNLNTNTNMNMSSNNQRARDPSESSKPKKKKRKVVVATSEGLLGPGWERWDATGLVEHYTHPSQVPAHLKKCVYRLCLLLLDGVLMLYSHLVPFVDRRFLAARAILLPVQ